MPENSAQENEAAYKQIVDNLLGLAQKYQQGLNETNFIVDDAGRVADWRDSSFLDKVRDLQEIVMINKRILEDLTDILTNTELTYDKRVETFYQYLTTDYFTSEKKLWAENKQWANFKTMDFIGLDSRVIAQDFLVGVAGFAYAATGMNLADEYNPKDERDNKEVGKRFTFFEQQPPLTKSNVKDIKENKQASSSNHDGDAPKSPR